MGGSNSDQSKRWSAVRLGTTAIVSGIVRAITSWVIERLDL